MSVQMHLLGLTMRVVYKHRTATAERMRARMEAGGPPADPPKGLLSRHEVSQREVQGRTCWSVVPRSPSGRGALYLHGGAYVAPITGAHWAMIGLLADAGMQVEVPLYGLAPQHTYREALPLLSQVHAELLAQVQDGGVAVIGDSAGGGLALAHAQAVLGHPGLPVRRLVLISPWLDGALADPGTASAERRDPWLSSEGLREAARAWSGTAGLEHPAVSPLHGPVEGLPPTLVLVGDRDLLRPSSAGVGRQGTQSRVAGRSARREGRAPRLPAAPCAGGPSRRSRGGRCSRRPVT